MNKVNFFTPVSYQMQSKSTCQSLLETVDNYFYLGGKKALVVHANEHELRAAVVDSKQSFLTTLLKVVSYCTVILPAILLLAKAILRWTQPAYEIDVPFSAQMQTRINDDEERASLYGTSSVIDAMTG